MSRSDASAPRGSSTLVVHGDPGVEIQVVDTNYRLRGQGTEMLRLDLEEGIYMVDWIASGQKTQKLVRLLPLEKALEIHPEAPPASGPAQALGAGAVEEVFSKTLEDMARPSERDYGSEIAIIICARSLEEKIDLSVGLRVLNHDDVAMRSDTSDAEALQAQTSHGYACRLYHVPPGDFRLRYISMSGETLDQTLPAFKGRRTVVFMYAGVGRVMTPVGDAYQAEDYQGVDPGRTVVVSVAVSTGAEVLAENARLGEILLHDLATGGGSLGASLVAALDTAEADPLLRIYAAAVVLVRLDRQASPALDESWPTESAEQELFRKRWYAAATRWLEGVTGTDAPPDVSALLWRLQALGEATGVKTARLTSPPMLECAWICAVARSTVDPKAVPAGVSFRAAGRSGGGEAPWLTWRAALAKGEIAVGAAKQGDLHGAIQAVAAKVREIVEADQATSKDTASSDALAFLSQDAKAMAVRTFQVTEPARVEQAAATGMDPAMELAALFGAPAAELEEQLLRTLTELDAGPVEPPPTAVRSRSRGPSDPPGLKARVQDPDDPNRGRFGGDPERDGLKLEAAFKETRNRDWVRCDLVVRDLGAGIPDGEEMEFFLHDSFRPSRVEATFRKGKASLAVTAWGGFTVGAWLPGRGVALELDLAAAPGAPRIIREL